MLVKEWWPKAEVRLRARPACALAGPARGTRLVFMRGWLPTISFRGSGIRQLGARRWRASPASRATPSSAPSRASRTVKARL